MRPFFEKWQQAKGAFAPSQHAREDMEPIRPDSPARMAADAAIECINCARMLCRLRYRALELRLSRAGGAQPRVDARERRARRRDRRASAGGGGHGGCHACHSHQSCQEHCPQQLNPTASIAGPQAPHHVGLSQGRAGMNVRLYVWQRRRRQSWRRWCWRISSSSSMRRAKGSVPPTFSRARAAVSLWASFYGAVRRCRGHSRGDRRSQCPGRMVAARGSRRRHARAGVFGVLLLVLGLRAVVAVVLP